KSTEYREWHRTEQNDEWITEAVKLRCEDKEDQNNRKQEDSEKLAALGPQLTGLAGIIENVSFRQNLVRLVLENLQRRIERPSWYSANGHGIELLHAVERPGDGFLPN